MELNQGVIRALVRNGVTPRDIAYVLEGSRNYSVSTWRVLLRYLLARDHINTTTAFFSDDQVIEVVLARVVYQYDKILPPTKKIHYLHLTRKRRWLYEHVQHLDDLWLFSTKMTDLTPIKNDFPPWWSIFRWVLSNIRPDPVILDMYHAVIEGDTLEFSEKAYTSKTTVGHLGPLLRCVFISNRKLFFRECPIDVSTIRFLGRCIENARHYELCTMIADFDVPIVAEYVKWRGASLNNTALDGIEFTSLKEGLWAPYLNARTDFLNSIQADTTFGIIKKLPGPCLIKYLQLRGKSLWRTIKEDYGVISKKSEAVQQYYLRVLSLDPAHHFHDPECQSVAAAVLKHGSEAQRIRLLKEGYVIPRPETALRFCGEDSLSLYAEKYTRRGRKRGREKIESEQSDSSEDGDGSDEREDDNDPAPEIDRDIHYQFFSHLSKKVRDAWFEAQFP